MHKANTNTLSVTDYSLCVQHAVNVLLMSYAQAFKCVLHLYYIISANQHHQRYCQTL